MRKRGKKTLMESAAELAESVLPTIESAMETAVEAAKDTVEKAAPILADGKKIARDKARRGRRRAAAKLAAVKEAEPAEMVAAFKAAEPKPEKRGRLKKLVLFSGLVALGGVVFKRLRGAPSKSNWQSSYVPQPAPPQAPTHKAEAPVAEAAAAPPAKAAPRTKAAPPAAAAPTADDEAAASPDEALADRATEPHPDTTPDNPAEVVELRAVEDIAVEQDTEASEAPAQSAGGARKKS